MNFDKWWESYWKPTGQPAVFDAAIREVALNAWDVATREALRESLIVSLSSYSEDGREP